MNYDEQQIYDSLNGKSPLIAIGANKEDLKNELRKIDLVLRCMPEVWPINYRELKEKNPVQYFELFDEKEKRPTLAGFKEELRLIIHNNQDHHLDARQKLIKGTGQYESYEEALNEIRETAVSNAGHLYAKTFNFAKSHAFILMDDDITVVSNLLSEALETALKLEIEQTIDSPYDMGNQENIQEK